MTKSNNKQSTIKVLVVEDEPALNDAYVRILEAEHMDVTACSNGREALERFAANQPDVILLDLKMPQMDGIAFLHELAKQTPKKKSEIIIFSNYDEQAEIKDAFALGATKYLLKAWASPTEVVNVVKEIVGKK